MAVGLHFRRGAHCASIPLPIRSARYRTATQAAYSTQARHTRAAQIFCLCRLSKSYGYRRYAPVIVLRGTVMPRLLEVADLCSRTVSDTANRLLKRTDSEGSSSVAE